MRFLQPVSGNNQAQSENAACNNADGQLHAIDEHLALESDSRPDSQVSFNLLKPPQPGRQPMQKRAFSSISQTHSSAVASVTTKKPRPSGPLDRFFNSKPL